jgi:hypothetical protein
MRNACCLVTFNSQETVTPLTYIMGVHSIASGSFTPFLKQLERDINTTLKSFACLSGVCP